MKTKQECKDETARDNNFDSFDRAIRYTFNRELVTTEKDFIDKIIDEAMEGYAQDLVKNNGVLPIVSGCTMLKYTDYKKQQALWIQIQDVKRTDMGTNTEQFCIKCYLAYLDMINFKNEAILKQIYTYLDNIGTYHITTGEEFYNRGYDKKIADNINELMDKLST